MLSHTKNLEHALRDFTRENYLAAGNNFLAVLAGDGIISYDLKKEINPARINTNIEYRSAAAKAADDKLIQRWAAAVHIAGNIENDQLKEKLKHDGYNSRATGKPLYEGLAFFIVKLRYGTPKKTDCTKLTRIINRNYNRPIVVLFCPAERDKQLVTLTFVGRRANKQNKPNDVIAVKVSMLYEINCDKPHRADLEILASLDVNKLLPNLSELRPPIEAVIAEWVEILAIDKLNNRFYKDLFGWFMKVANDPEVKFPAKHNLPSTSEADAKKEQIIRLITRFMFIWFIKEKGLVTAELFDQEQVFDGSDLADDAKRTFLLKGKYESDADNYYRAILQNLFFATLNTPIKDEQGKPNRGFSKKGNAAHRVFSSWRYEKEINNPKNFASVMNKIPFINGGLFDCLDGFHRINEGKNKDKNGYRMDCFTDNKNQRSELFVPNWVFFAEGAGLIEIFNGYKFTVEENTPLDEDVALDPELLGRVFENLLAYYNPETRDTAQKAFDAAAKAEGSKRKKSGSYYTPRHIVDFMVNSAIKKYLAAYLNKKDIKHSEDDLVKLLDFSEDKFSGSDELISPVIEAISRLEVLDPAVGSGAFPMEVLRYCVEILRKLDPRNKQWRQQQIDNLPSIESLMADVALVEGIQDEPARQKALQELTTRKQQLEDFSPMESLANDFALVEQLRDEKTKKKARAELKKREQEIRDKFKASKPDSDYLRKLYIIRNSIYGVDIQPIACQIAKLRFFISLAIEQEIEPEADNLGIESLPNLETNFIAADSLLKLHSGGHEEIFASAESIQKIQKEIKLNRDKFFNANTRELKRDLIEKDRELRDKLGQEMREVCGLSEELTKAKQQDYQQQLLSSIDKITSHDIMDQNTVANWFDPIWMFGKEEFDIVIANPPYIQLQRDGSKLSSLYKDEGYETFAGSGDIYILFYEKAINLLKTGGILSFITSNQWLRKNYGRKLRDFFTKNTAPSILIDLGLGVFENASVLTNIIIASKIPLKQELTFPGITLSENNHRNINNSGYLSNAGRVITGTPGDQWLIISAEEEGLRKKIESLGAPLTSFKHRIEIYMGIKTGYNPAFIIDKETKNKLIAENPNSKEIIRSVIRGRGMKDWQLSGTDEYFINTHNGYFTKSHKKIPPIDVNDYPAIKEHLDQYKVALQKRGDQGHTFYNLRSFDETYLFDEEKFVLADIASEPKFYYDNQKHLTTNSTYIIVGRDMKYIAAFLSSYLTRAIFKKFYVAGNLSSKTLRFNAAYLGNLRVPILRDKGKEKLVALVDKLIPLTRDRNNVDLEAINKIQAQIDQLVIKAYQLTDDEVQLLLSPTANNKKSTAKE